MGQQMMIKMGQQMIITTAMYVNSKVLFWAPCVPLENVYEQNVPLENVYEHNVVQAWQNTKTVSLTGIRVRVYEQ